MAKRPSSSATPLRIGLLVALGLLAVLLLWSLLSRSPEQPAVAPTPALGGRTITILTPAANSTVTSPLAISGTVSAVPPTGTLNFRLFGADGALLAQGAFAVQGAAGAPGTFSGSVPYTLAAQSVGRIEVLELNAVDGSIAAIAAAQVVLSPAQGEGGTPGVEPTGAAPSPTALPPPSPSAEQQIFIDSPPNGTTVGSPMTITGRTTKLPTGNAVTDVIREAADGV